MKLTLPYPVSSNRYWRSFSYLDKVTRKPRSVVVLSDEAKSYKAEAGWRAKAAGIRDPIVGPVEVRVVFYPRDRRLIDLDNALKVALDALNGIAYGDDKQICRIVAERRAPHGEARLEVEILPFTVPMELEVAA